MSPSFSSGVGFALIISLAIDQIFCLAPSINPLIELVVSSTKQTSMRGFLFWLGVSVAKAEHAINKLKRIVFIWLAVRGDYLKSRLRFAPCSRTAEITALSNVSAPA